MPNIPPRGVYARRAGQWHNPTRIFARVGGEWRPVEFVWVYENDQWEVAWAETAPGSFTAVVNNNGTATSSVRLDWQHPPVGPPDQYRVYRNDVLHTTVSGATLTWTDTAPLRGTQIKYEIRSVFGGVEDVGSARTVNVAAVPPTAVALNFTTSPIQNLRLTWSHPSGSRTGYLVQRSTNGSTWTNHATLASGATQSDWSTTVQGWMRVRTLSAGGSSGFVQRGPVTPVTDVTPPANATVTNWRPEASFGRMVVRFTTPNDLDFAQYLVQERLSTSAPNWANVTGWTNAARNTNYAVVCSTRPANVTAQVRILVRDNAVPIQNVREGPIQSYNIVSSPTIINPSGHLSGTWRTATGGWRNDATRSTTEIATGWTSSGHNIGCFFYGTTIATAIGGKTVTSMTIQYYREGHGGFCTRVNPVFWGHNLTSRSGIPTLFELGASEAARTGPGLGRTTCGLTPYSATFTLPSSFIPFFQNGAARGIAMYRGYQGSGNPDNYYGLFGIGGQAAQGIVNGRLTFTHLG